MRSEHNTRGNLPRVRNMSNDIQDASNAMFFAAISTGHMPMAVSDPNQPDNPIVFVNDAFLELTGYTKEEVIGHNCRFLQGPETDQQVVADLSDGVKQQQKMSVEILNYKKDGTAFWNALYISPVFSEKGDLIYFFASQMDITKAKEAEDTLRQSQKMEAVGQLTGGIAHDFNNLLTVVQGFGELLLTSLNSENFNIDRAKRYVESILQAAEKGATLNNQLLAFSRKKKLEGKIINIHDLIDKLEPLIVQSVGEGIKVEVTHHGSGCCSKMDPVQTETAIINVAVNARDAMKGHGKLEIVTETVTIDSADTIYGHIDHGEYLSVSISDNGPGMTHDILTRITEPFFTTKCEGKGTGLGMSMVHGFVKQSEGVLKIESEVGQGTVVHMLFPREQNEPENRISIGEQIITDKYHTRASVLVVEDKSQVADYVDHVLSEFGYTVHRAANASEALDVLAVCCDSDHPINILFSDIKMPGDMNGVQLARLLRKQNPEIQILLTTGHDDESIDITDHEGKPFDLIKKPYRQSDLVNRLKLLYHM